MECRQVENEISICKMSENVEEDENYFGKIVADDNGFVLQDVPHLTDYIKNLSTHTNPMQLNKSYSSVKQYFVDTDDTITQNVVVQNDGPKRIHFRRAGPRQRVYFKSDEVNACIVTCGGICPGLNTVIREIVCGLSYMYNVNTILGIKCGYKGFYARNTIPLTSKYVNDIHKHGGTILGTSRGGHDTIKIVDSIQDRGINQVYIIGGDGTQKGASLIFEEIRRRDLKVSIFGIPKTIDNDIPVIDKSFGFDTVVEEAQRAINAAHVEAQSGENGISVVKLMGRNSGYIAMHATLASRDVDCCLIPESPFYLEGPGGLFEYITKRLRENGHLVIVVAEGAGQELMSEQSINMTDASGNNLLLDVGMWLSQKIKEHFINIRKMVITLRYIDPTYMIQAIPSNASDNVYCTLLAQSAVHGAMAGYTGCIVGPVNGRHAYIPFHRIIDTQNQVVITDRMWAQLLSSTNQPSFLNPVKKDVDEKKTGTLSHQIGGSGDDVKDPALDRLSIIHSGLSEIVSQIDELVSKGIEHKLVDKMDSGVTESFIQFLTDTHLSLKSWVPRFQNAFGGKTQYDETSIDNATDTFDEVVSPSPLVSPWWADNYKVEGGKQLFLLTPLPRSKQPPKTVSRLCGPNFLKCSGKKIIHMTPSSIVRPPPLPSARKFPCEGVDVAETVEANATTKTKKIKFRKGTPFVKSDKKSKLSDDLDCDDEFMVDLASRFPKLLENSVILEKQPLHSKSMHEQGLKLLDLEVVDSDSSTTTSEEEEMGSSDWKGKGESTLKRDLWTKFEALSVLPPQMQDDDTYILQNTSMKGFLEILEVEGGLVKQSTAESEMRDIKVD